ncbi:hypothetical protein CEUSTIGMA_g1279.t1 [Chlamydomonas eustigma]|uniref:Thiamine phosphate synthase/TenI domain-containing protein n=1 Tax=Chlamydomonas eustigma TaxID=1157962 RepID=A0A250WSL6_9CHLO|nr:hypothetical protein CEUSTIGMA_g1279.t1 [Chlamydomonas eustigma]|eukprot:GAX73828.1 hypothetical protein CEUSTIGMA_g1279.t1 [Chlamydomonas eustigma]
MNVIVITPPKCIPKETLVIKSLFDSGLQTLHLRKPGLKPDGFKRILDDIPQKYHSKIMLHSCHEVSKEYAVKGLHYPSAIRPPTPINHLEDSLLQQSTSFHTLEEVLREGGWGEGLSYAFLSPIFNSISKQGYLAAAFEEMQLEQAVRKSSVPVIALGGVSVDKIPFLHRMGFSGIATIGTIWESVDPVASFEALQSECCKLAV